MPAYLVLSVAIAVVQNPTTAELVIEVAVSSVSLDRENASLYAEAGIKEYWIVLAQENEVEVYRHPMAGAYLDKRIYQTGDLLVCESVPAIGVPLAELFG